MQKFSSIAAGLALLFISPGLLACDYPTQIDIPNGDTATRDEMLDGQRSVKDFVATMETYLECLVEEERATRSQLEELTPEDEQLREDMLNKKYNAAVEEMEKVAAEFNAEVQAYKARSE